jgi:DNA-binding GntR family transcriptional regulator
MSGIPKRQSLVSQTAAYLRAKFATGIWNPSLPGERRLCETLQVSRNTLRAALQNLANAGARWFPCRTSGLNWTVAA